MADFATGDSTPVTTGVLSTLTPGGSSLIFPASEAMPETHFGKPVDQLQALILALFALGCSHARLPRRSLGRDLGLTRRAAERHAGVGSGSSADGSLHERLDRSRTPASRRSVTSPRRSASGRSAVREALAALEILGIVDVRPGSGTYLRGTASELLPQTLRWGLLIGEKQHSGTAGASLRPRDLCCPARCRPGDGRRSGGDRGPLERMRADLGDLTAFARADLDFHRASPRRRATRRSSISCTSCVRCCRSTPTVPCTTRPRRCRDRRARRGAISAHRRRRRGCRGVRHGYAHGDRVGTSLGRCDVLADRMTRLNPRRPRPSSGPDTYSLFALE